METIIILKNFKTGAYSVKNFKDEDEAIQWWYSFSSNMDWDIVYLGTNNSVY